jgi:hypothetical protein
MTKEEENIVLREICARLPFCVFCERNGQIRKIVGVDLSDKYPIKVENGDYCPNTYRVDEIRLLLRPYSKMTDEETREYVYGVIRDGVCDKMTWFYEHEIDYNSLIDRKLADELTLENYKSILNLG